jgi:hypothetical protein
LLARIPLRSMAAVCYATEVNYSLRIFRAELPPWTR